MTKIVIGSHGTMAQGIQSTLELFAGTELDITYMSAYVEGQLPIETQIEQFMATLTPDDQVIIFTDLFGGSVNQKFALATEGRANTYLIAGFNLPLIVELALAGDNLTPQQVAAAIKTAQQAMQQVDLHNQPEVAPVAAQKAEPQLAPAAANQTHLAATLRVDERLIHGQIAMVWSRELNLDGIIVANDEVAANETQQMALKMAVPSGIRVLIRDVDSVATILHDPRAAKKRLLILVRTVADALRLTQQVSMLDYVNIGNVGKSVSGEKQTLTQFVMLTPSEYAALGEVVKLYPKTALQNLPSDKKLLALDMIKGTEE